MLNNKKRDMMLVKNPKDRTFEFIKDLEEMGEIYHELSRFRKGEEKDTNKIRSLLLNFEKKMSPKGFEIKEDIKSLITIIEEGALRSNWTGTYNRIVEVYEGVFSQYKEQVGISK